MRRSGEYMFQHADHGVVLGLCSDRDAEPGAAGGLADQDAGCRERLARSVGAIGGT